jgi:quinol monooxygenase YgiN
MNFSARPFAACCLGELPLGDETRRDLYIRTIDTFRTKSNKMPGLISMNLFEPFPVTLDNINNTQQSQSSPLQTETEGPAPAAETKIQTQKQTTTVQTILFSLWRNETLQKDNFFMDHSLDCLDALTNVYTAYPKFSFWVQVNGRAVRQNQHLALPLPGEGPLATAALPLSAQEIAQPLTISPCHDDSDFIVFTDWKARSQAQMDTCLPFLFGLREIAYSQRVKKKMSTNQNNAGGISNCGLNEAQTSEDLDSSSLSIAACRDYDLYLTHNMDDPNEFRESIVWTSKEAYDIFIQLPSVQGIYSTMDTMFCQPNYPSVSFWRKMSRRNTVKADNANPTS